MENELTTQSGHNGLATFENAPTMMQMLFDPETSSRVKAIADTLAKGAVTTPRHLVGKQADCLALTLKALSLNMSPFDFVGSTFVTPDGKIGYEAKLIAAIVQASGSIRGSFHYEPIGDWDEILSKAPVRRTGKTGKEFFAPGYTHEEEVGLGVIASAVLAGEDQPTEHRLLLTSAWPRFSTQWATNPWLQLCYAATRQWARLNASSCMFGVFTEDDPRPAEIDVTPIDPPPEIHIVKREPDTHGVDDGSAKQITAKPQRIDPEKYRKQEHGQDPATQPGPADPPKPAATPKPEEPQHPAPASPLLPDASKIKFNPSIHVSDANGVPTRTKLGLFRVQRGKAMKAKQWEALCKEAAEQDLEPEDIEIQRSTAKAAELNGVYQEGTGGELPGIPVGAGRIERDGERGHVDEETITPTEDRGGKGDLEPGGALYITAQGHIEEEEIPLTEDHGELVDGPAEPTMQDIFAAMESASSFSELDEIGQAAMDIIGGKTDAEAQEYHDAMTAAVRRVSQHSRGAIAPF